MALNSSSILVASEDSTLFATIKDSLHINGFRVSSAWAPDDQPGVIVLDTALPPGARKELLQSLRASTASPRPPIVALSSREKLHEDAQTEGVWVCLAKPIELDSLVLAVDRISKYTGI